MIWWKTSLLAVAMAAPIAATAQVAHEHALHGSEALVSQMHLDPAGKKWPTDATQRASMAEIRKAFEANHATIHAGTETDAQYAALAASIEREVNTMVKKCHLPPDVDAQFHYVIADLLQGASWMRGKDRARGRHEGAALVHGALIAYGKYFRDTTWKPMPAMEHH